MALCDQTESCQHRVGVIGCLPVQVPLAAKDLPGVADVSENGPVRKFGRSGVVPRT